MGLAALGSVGLAVTRNSWAAQSAQLPTSAQASCPGHRPGRERRTGQRVVAQQLGPAAQPLAESAFVDGLHVALLIGGGLMLVAAAFAFIQLRRPAVTVPTGGIAVPSAGDTRSRGLVGLVS